MADNNEQSTEQGQGSVLSDGEGQQTENAQAESTQTENTEQESQAESEKSPAEKLYNQESGESEQGESEQSEQSEGESDNQKSDSEDSDNQDSSEEESDNQESTEEPTYDFSPPEGIEVDTEAKGQFQELAKEHGLSEEVAKQFWDLGMQTLQNNDPQKFMEQARDQNRTAWYNEVKNDPELGGENFEQTQQLAKRAVKEFGDENFLNLLEDSGLANHPTVVRYLTRVGKEVSEGSFSKSNSGNSQPKSAAHILYPNQN